MKQFGIFLAVSSDSYTHSLVFYWLLLAGGHLLGIKGIIWLGLE
jgi:hypothetical protein